ncbi:hypothetical protein GJAV_G00043550 [Gymnothorax javanicus]|nr:hypothetical protein GJAV_G00043550 [Gymnothorax javanicus]
MALIADDQSCKLGGSAATCTRLGVRRDCIPYKTSGGIYAKMQHTEAEFSTDGLPKAFLHSLRTLFDILDDGKRGIVHISDIEGHWQGTDTLDLPGGVLECLRKVAPPHGYLTFERFVAGLRYSMLNSRDDHLKLQSSFQKPLILPQPAGMKIAQQPTRSAPGQKHPGVSHCSSWGLENKVRPLGPSNGTNVQHHCNVSHHNRPKQDENLSCEYVPYSKPGESLVFSSILDSATPGCPPEHYTNTGHERTGRIAECPETKCSGEWGLPRSLSETTTGLAASRRHGRSREEQRRHTITNGVDYGMLKQMKELEQEKDSLLAGLDVVDRAREWYQSQIQHVTERQRAMAQSSQCSDFYPESSQTRLNVILPKLQEVNHCLNDLISCSGMPFTASGTLPSVPPNPQPAPPAPHKQFSDSRIRIDCSHRR